MNSYGKVTNTCIYEQSYIHKDVHCNVICNNKKYLITEKLTECPLVEKSSKKKVLWKTNSATTYKKGGITIYRQN